MASNYTDFFLNTSSNIVGLQLLEIGHVNFSQTYYIVRNADGGITVTHEDATVHTYTYYPLAITPKASLNDLDAGLTIALGDLGLVIPQEIDRVRAAGNFLVKPYLKYRMYRSDILTAPMFGPITLEITNLSQTREGAAFDADAPQLNLNATGELYNLDRFPTLKGFLFATA